MTGSRPALGVITGGRGTGAAQQASTEAAASSEITIQSLIKECAKSRNFEPLSDDATRALEALVREHVAGTDTLLLSMGGQAKLRNIIGSAFGMAAKTEAAEGVPILKSVAQTEQVTAEHIQKAIWLVENGLAPLNPAISEANRARAAAYKPHRPKPYQAAEEAAETPARPKWSELAMEHKVSAGMNGAIALLAGFGAINAARQAVVTDETGQQHMNWSQAGVAMLQTAFAVGCGYFAVKALGGGRG